MINVMLLIHWERHRLPGAGSRGLKTWIFPYYHHLIIIVGQSGSWTDFPRSPRVSARAGGGWVNFQDPRNSVMEREIWTSPSTYHHHFSQSWPQSCLFITRHTNLNKPYKRKVLELRFYSLFEIFSHSIIIIISWKADPNYVLNKRYKLINFLFSHS